MNRPRPDAPIMHRRALLQGALAATGLSALRAAPGAEAAAAAVSPLIDTNVTLSRWPLRRLPDDDTPALVDHLRRAGVTEAWAGSFDALLHRDLGSANARLADECRAHGPGFLVPFGAVNPQLPDWEDDLRRCAEEHAMPGIRLHPAYHGYPLDDPALARLLRLAAARGLVVQIALCMEDRRTMHPLFQVDPPATAPLAALVRATPGLRLELLNALKVLRGKPLVDLLGAGDVCVEIAMLEGVGGVGNLLAQAPPGRVLFGSHAPLFCLESALLKLKESPIAGEQLRAVRHDNARRLLARSQT